MITCHGPPCAATTADTINGSPCRYFFQIFNRKVFVPDTQRVPGGAPGRRFHAPAPGDTTTAHFRVRVAGLSEAVIVAHTEQLLRPRRVPHPQGRRAHVYLLPMQRVHGSGTKRNGRRHFGYVWSVSTADDGT